MKKFIQTKLFGRKKKPTTDNNDESNESQSNDPSNGDVSGDNRVMCMDCGNRTKLFYDLSASVRDEGEGDEIEKDLEGYDLGDKDPIRCILCRKYAKFKENEPIQCEDCLTNATIFYWSGPDQDVILCEDCFQNGESYERDGFVVDDDVVD